MTPTAQALRTIGDVLIVAKIVAWAEAWALAAGFLLAAYYLWKDR